MGSSNSFGNVAIVPSLALFRGLTASAFPPVVFLQGTSTPLDGGQSFYQVSLTDKTTADNGTTVIVDGGGYRWFQVTIPEPTTGITTVPEGGTGVGTWTSNGIPYGQGTSPIAFTAAGSNNQILIGNTGAAPSWLSSTANVLAFLITPSSANLAAAVTDETGSGALVFATSPTLVTPILGTPTSGNLANCTGYPVASIANLGAGVATFLTTPSSANLAAAVSDETGSGSLVFATSPTLVTPALGTPASGTMTNCTGGPWITRVISQVFTATGTYTPTSGMKYCVIECVGAGGGGGGATSSAAQTGGGGGGGAGSYSRAVASAATIGVSQAVTIGTAGAAGTNAPAGGGNGGATSVGVICTANGGSGGAAGTSANSGAGGLGGTAGAGDVAATGQPGTAGFGAAIITVSAFGGAGGSGAFGGGGLGTVTGTTSAGNAGTGKGSGGSGGASYNGGGAVAGGAGTAGYVVITEYCTG